MQKVLTLILAGALAAGAALAAQTRSAADLFREALAHDEIKGDLPKAIAIYQTILAEFPADRPVAARALLHLGRAFERLGRPEAAATYERLARDYADQPALAAEARTRLAALRPRTTAQDGTALVERQQVWAGDDVNLEGRPSWDGRFFPYVDRSAGSANLAIRNLVTGEKRILEQAKASASGFPHNPAISPDGQFVAYSWYAYTPDGDRHSINLIHTDGTGMRVVTTVAAAPDDLLWAPDGKRLAAVLVNMDRTTRIALVDVSGGTTTQLRSTRDPWLGGFSANGEFLVYSDSPAGAAPEETDADVFIISVDGKRESAAVVGPSRDKNPEWTPDGNAVVWVRDDRDRSGSQGLWAVRVSHGRAIGSPHEIRPDVGPIRSFGFTRDGAFLYGLDKIESDVFIAPVDPETLSVTGTPQRLSDHLAGSNSTPHWSPDGRSVAFLRGLNPRARSIVIRSVNDGIERTLPIKLLNPMTYGWNWFPDSRSLLIRDRHPDKPERVVVRKVDVSTGADTLLFEANEWDVWPPLKLSPDAKSVYYTAFSRDTTRNVNDLRLMRRDLATGHETELLRRETGFFSFYGLMVSPDASRLVFLDNVGSRPRTLLTMPTSGGQPAEMYPTDGRVPRPTSNVGAWLRSWTPDGRYVISKTGGDEVWAFPIGSGEPRKLVWPLPAVGELSPDGRHTVYPVTRQTRELRTIQNLLSRIQPAQ
jgi:Tol biopolymer transport system component